MKLSAKPLPLTEKQIEKSILMYLRARGIFAFKLNTTGVYDARAGAWRRPMSPFILAGISDIVGILKGGRMLCIEVKTPRRKKNVSVDQKRFLDAINRDGGLAFVATSVEDIIAHLESAK